MDQQRKHESPEIGAAAARMLRALVRRAQEGDWEALEQLAELENLASCSTQAAGHLMQTEFGYSYTQLGDVLGITRQAARQRFSKAPSSMLLYWLSGRGKRPALGKVAS